jgi:transposase
MQIATIGLDIAKNVFQVHGIDAAERAVVRKQLRRRQVLEFFKALAPCLVGMEACATAHYWARELMKLGHLVRLMPARDVKAYVKRNKNDAADAEAICEAVRRPTMRFVQIKSTEQQGRLMLHRARDLLMRQRTQVINALRAHLAEFGIVAPQGRQGVKELLLIIAGGEDERLPVDAHASLVVLSAEFTAMQTMIGSIEKRILALHCSNEASRRLETVPGIGVAGATAITATVPDPTVFRSGRDFAAWVGLVPRRLDRRQAAARADLETRGSLFAPHSGGRSRRGVAVRAAEPREVSLARAASRSQTVQGSAGGACQQDGTHRLGIAGQGRHLSGTCACGSGLKGPSWQDELRLCVHELQG